MQKDLFFCPRLAQSQVAGVRHHLHIISLEKGLHVALHTLGFRQPGQTSHIHPLTRIAVGPESAGGVTAGGTSLGTPATHGKGGANRLLSSPLGLRLGHTRLDSDRAALHLLAIKLEHGPLGILLGLEVDKAIGGVTAGEGVHGNVDALAIKIMSQLPSLMGSCGSRPPSGARVERTRVSCSVWHT